VILLTHDRALAEIARTSGAGWRSDEVVQWTPQGGPVLGAGDPADRLAEKLDGGAAASELGGLARRALEEALARPVRELGYEIRYDPQLRHTAHDFLRALRGGLKRQDSHLTDLPVLRRIEMGNYMATLGVHYRPNLAPPTSDELRALLEDVRELQAAFRSSSCHTPVWAASTKTGHQCGCSALAA
jgi:hypothetical protein